MRLSNRVRKLEAAAPPVRRGPPLPTDPVSFARGLLAGAFRPEDIDPTHPHHTEWAVRASTFLVTLTTEHQAWLRAERQRHPGAYPGELLVPAPDDQILAALDAVMRRGEREE